MEAVRRTSATVLLLASVVTVAGKAADYVGRGSSGSGDRYADLPEFQDLQSFRDLMDKRFDKLQNIIVAQIDYFSRRLDAFDTKLDKLEASVFSELNKIAEHLINHKVQNEEARVKNENNRHYVAFDRKVQSLEGEYQLTLGKIEGTSDAIVKRLEKLEQQIEKRDSNLEAEISYVIASLEVVKGKQTTLESKLGNTSPLLNMTKHIQKLLIHFHTDEKKHMNKLHDNIISSLVYLDNKTTEHFLISDQSNQLLRPLKKELKEDFNNYANKVADMTSDLGSSTSKLQKSFESIESQVNGLERGVKALISRTGIGGGPNGSIVCDEESIQEVMRSKFEKVLANQEEFMKGCYKVQMQEPQIEGEISAMLEKLLDMLDKRFGENDRDARTVKHLIKNHHEQTQRNLVQLNENIASVFGRSTSSIQEIEDVIADVQENVNALYTYLRGVLPERRQEHFEVILDKLQKIEEYTKMFKGWPEDVKPELKSIQNTLSRLMKVISPANKPNNQDADTVNAVQNVFGTSPSSSNSATTELTWDPALINIRGDLDLNRDAIETESATSTKPSNETGTTLYETVISPKNGTTPPSNGTIGPVTSSQNGAKDPADGITTHYAERHLKNETRLPSNDDTGTSVSGNAGTWQNDTNPSNDVTEITVASSQNVSTVSSNDKTGTILTAVTPSHNEPETTVTSTENSSKISSSDEPGTTMIETAISSENFSQAPSNNVPGKNLTKSETPSENISKVPSNGEAETMVTKNVSKVPTNNEPETTVTENGSEVPSNDESGKNAMKNVISSENTSNVPSNEPVTTENVPKVSSNDDPEETVAENVSKVPSNDEPGKNAIKNVTFSKNTSKIPTNDEPATTVTENDSKVSSSDEPEKTIAENVSKVPSNEEPGKIETSSTHISKIPSNDEAVIENDSKVPSNDEPATTVPASITSSPNTSQVPSDDSKDEFSYSKLPNDME